MKWIPYTVGIIGAMCFLSGCSGHYYEETYSGPCETVVYTPVYRHPRPVIIREHWDRPVRVYRPPHRVIVPPPVHRGRGPECSPRQYSGGRSSNHSGQGRRSR
jgi:hypothetical protein